MMPFEISRGVRALMLVGLLLPLLAGCGTMRRDQVDGLYPAARGDLLIIYIGSSSLIHLDGHVSIPEQLVLRPVMIVLGLVDLPVSLATDTLLLPYDISQESRGKKVDPAAQGEESEESDSSPVDP